MDETEEMMDERFERYEDSTHEWKIAWTHNCLRDVAAMYNSNGGTIVVGRDENGQFQDVHDIDVLREQI